MQGRPTTTRFTGAAGTADWTPFPHTGENWREQTTIDTWLIDAPGQSPAWRYYILFGVHLRDVEGQEKAPHKRTEDASHEIIVLALSPAHYPERPDPETFHSQPLEYLTPANISIQIRDSTDEQCRELLMLLAKGMAHGYLPSEPPFPNATREPTWLRSIQSTLEHIKLGGHPEAQA